jgi:hypothetical protein
MSSSDEEADEDNTYGVTLAQNQALRTANGDLAVSVARLRGELAEALRAAPPCAPPPRGPPSLQETPVEVLAQILGFLDHPADVFAMARSCRLGREASRTRGAFRHVFLHRLDWNHEETRNGLFWPARDEAVAVVHNPPGPLLFFLASCDAPAGIRSLALSRYLYCDPTSSGLLELVGRCSALESLQLSCPMDEDYRGWSPENVDAILRAASATSVRRVLVPIMGTTLDALAELPCLELLALSHEACEVYASGHCTAEDLQPVQDLLPRLHTLRELVVDALFDVMLPFAVRSATLERLEFSGSGLLFTVMDCPRLTSVDICQRECYTTSDYAMIALALIRGCPLLQWRAPPINKMPELTNENCRRDAKQGWLACAQALENDPLLRQLADDEDAVGFLVGIIWRPIVNGRLQ